MDQLLAKLDKLLSELDAQIAVQKNFPHEQQVKDRKKEINDLKVDISLPGADPTGKIPMKDGKVDKETWEKKSDQDKRDLWDKLDIAFTDLRCLNQDRLCVGRWYFLIFALLLIVTAVSYHAVHRAPVGQFRLRPERAAAIWEAARKLELKLTEIKGKKDGDLSEAKADLDELKKLLWGGEAPMGEARLEKKGERPAEKKTESPAKQGEAPLPSETSLLLGAVSAEIERKDQGVHRTYQDFLKKLKADIESLSTAYFWTIPPWRWFELAWWAAMGCLVGLLFYIATNLGQGVFRPEEISMFWTELLIAPIVVPVVFFLFAFTDITGFIPSEASLTVQIGVAFIFGFAIRRTMGLLDTIKNRFFPTP